MAIKPLVPVAGEPMINHPARTLLAHPTVGQVIILTQSSAPFAADPATAWLTTHPQVRFEQSGAGIAFSLLALLERGDVPFPILLTTADHVLLDSAMLDQFTQEAAGADIAVAMGWKIVSAFGPVALIGTLLRLLTLRGGIARIGRRFGLVARLVAMEKAEACIEADKPDDVVLIERIVAARA